MIAGATATGKTELAVQLAETLGDAEIISADSRQVYRGMDVGTAKAGPALRRRVTHHGLDLVEPDEPFTAADFQRHAMEALVAMDRGGRVAMLVGGTGLYLRVVARGILLPPGTRDETLRARLEADLAEHGLTAAAGELRRLAPSLAAATDPANPRRVVRALERAHLAGDRLPDPAQGYGAPVLWLGLQAEPAEHRTWIAQRAADQFRGGLLEEAARLRTRFPASLAAFSAFGYREAMAHLVGELDHGEALERTVARTRAYARRQRTWFRREPGITWIAAGPSAEMAAREAVLRFLDRSGQPPPRG